MIELNKIYNENCLTGLKKLPDNSIDCCVTSPPYYGLRDYGNDDQIGLEETPELFVANLSAVFEEVRRVLKPEGTLWLNLGDSYWGGKGKSGSQSPEEADERNKEGLAITSKNQQLGGNGYTRPTDKKHFEIKPKDLIGIPWMVAFSLRSAGWYLRQDIIWNKPNPMPESVTDRCTKSHEYIFLLSKSSRYYYDADAIKEPCKTFDNGIRDSDNSRLNNTPGRTRMAGLVTNDYEVANKRSVWTVNTMPYSEAHFATFPERLIIDCIKAGSSEFGCCKDCGTPYKRQTESEFKVHENWYGDKTKYTKNSRGTAGNSYKEKISTTTTGWTKNCNCQTNEVTAAIILDPFMGAGTTALVARKLNRNFIGFELNPDYIKIAETRLQNQLGMFI